MTVRSSFVFLLLLLFNTGYSQFISPEKAGCTGINFMIEKTGDHSFNTGSVQEIVGLPSPGQVLIYAVNFMGNQGFVLVAADERVFPVMGYSLEGNYHNEGQPPQFQGLLSHYENQVRQVIREKLPASEKISAAWKHYNQGEGFVPGPNSLDVNPLLTTQWDQGCYYNDSCPADPSSWACQHVVTGCVATATAQIIKYHNFPPMGSGSHTFTHPQYGSLSANFGNTTYNWTSMPDELQSPDPDVAQLIYHVGVGSEMNYGPYGSGTPSSKAATALVHFFNYSTDLSLVEKSDYSDSAWIALIRNEIDQQRPVYYAGYNPDEGHAFVCDGYQGSDFFHFNWGWSGAYDGYFFLGNLNPGGTPFNNYQEAIIGIEPGTSAPCQGLTSLTAPLGVFSDGSYASSYSNNLSCEWLIQPVNNPAYISLEFMTFSTESNADLVKVFDGPDSSAPLLGIFSGYSLPPVVNSSGNSLFIQFISNSTLSQSGWSAEYRTHFCFPSDTLTGSSGFLSDGSGNLDYMDESDCYWLIQQPGAYHIALVFNAFDTEYDYDFLTIYDGDNISANVLGVFSGDTLPFPVISSQNALLLHFTSDAAVTGGGWETSYTTSVGLSDNPQEGQLLIYPNPARDALYLKTNPAASILSYEIFNASGQGEIADDVIENQDIKISIAGLADGYYYIRIKMKDGVVVREFVKISP